MASKVHPKEGAPIYRAQSGHDFALADRNVRGFSRAVRATALKKPGPVLVVIVRKGEGDPWREFQGAPSLPGLCVDDLHLMSKLWRKYGVHAKKPKCYAS